MLSHYAYLDTTDFEVSRAYHAAARFDLRPLAPVGRDGHLSSRVNAMFERHFQLYFFSYSASIRLDALSDNANYVIPVRLEAGSTGHDVARFDGRIGSPGRADPLLVPAGYAHLGLGIDAALLRAHAELLLGELPDKPISFTPDFSTDRSLHRTLAHLIKHAAEEEEAEPWSLRDPIRGQSFLSSVMNLLLLHQPHSLSHLALPGAGPAPRDVKRVLDYIEAHLDRPVTLATLVAVGGVPGRTLNEHFRRFTGLSPMAYHRKRRLEAAHRALCAGDGTSVTDIALRFGFNNVGRFAALYRQAHGVTPAQHLRR
ncbi:helix-turn-helix domain-containing protein [Pseudaestuariivita atlantica]|uniref:helix-turn-helix domain-containing protein n=1 Tax=Pseudaestuariivita atlantica TaxID=1317121 RepID=UPI00067D3CC7|nr:AraC family transcriptional regulator [Pseudaestuariivita atlantica]